MAERFELCLKAEMYPVDAKEMSVDEMWKSAKDLQRTDKYGQALLIYESLLERRAEIPEADREQRTIDIRQERINCLFRMGREGTAKEACEKLLNSTGLSPRQTVNALNSLAMCCSKLDKFAVALMVIGMAETTIRDNEGMDQLAANLAMLKGNICAFCDNFVDAVGAYRTAAASYDKQSRPFESCRARLNMAACFIELRSNTQARAMLNDVLRTAESAGYDRQKAFVLSHMALLAYRNKDLAGAETYCLRSNQLARPREYSSVVFRNCFYLWRIAQARGDEAGVRSNLRTLRTYLTRVERFLPEAEEFRAFLGGGTDE
jgi:tetratricopeptide (TPR) repeat protein